MVVIRLARHGKKGAPIFKVTVADQKYALTGRFLEKIGTYVPGAKTGAFQLDTERFNAWVAKGAQPTDRVKKLIQTYAITPATATAAATKSAAKTAAKK
jgi:small subunit ribosomal protein S16